jgi:hypothetical protein
MANPERNVDPIDQIGGAGCLVRLGWMMVGNVVLAACAAAIATRTGSFFSAADVVLWAVVPILIWLRYVDITRMKGQTAGGQPASLSHWKRYVGLLLACCLVAWAAAHAIAWFRG